MRLISPRIARLHVFQLWMTPLIPGDANPVQRSIASLLLLDDVIVAVTAGRMFALRPSNGAIVRKEAWPGRMGQSCVAAGADDAYAACSSWQPGSACVSYRVDRGLATSMLDPAL